MVPLPRRDLKPAKILSALDDIADARERLSKWDGVPLEDTGPDPALLEAHREFELAVMKAARLGLQNHESVAPYLAWLRHIGDREFLRSHGKRIRAERAIKRPNLAKIRLSQAIERFRADATSRPVTSIRSAYLRLRADGLVSGSYESFRQRFQRLVRDGLITPFRD